MLETRLTGHAGVEYPIICGAMYPCSNPELVAAVSDAGGLGIVQPISLVYVHGYELREGLRAIRKMTDKPLGFNVLVEKSAGRYEERMRRWVNIALDEGIRFFITALGKPKWVVDLVHGAGGFVYHDVTNVRFAQKALESGVDGLVCVNNRAGGHAGTFSAEQLFEDLSKFQVPLVCAGGIGSEADFKTALETGYAGVQMGTRFIATKECTAHEDYKRAILKSGEEDIVMTDKISGVPVSVIRTEYIDRIGTHAGFFTKKLLRWRKTRYLVRTLFTLRSFRMLGKASLEGSGYLEYFQAGKSVEGINSIEPAGEIVKRFAKSVS